MKKYRPCFLLVLMLVLAGLLYSEIVINEIMYDPDETDTGYEWLELYNNGNTDIELEGCRLQAGGSTFSDIFIFPHYILRAKRFLLIGESNITQALFSTDLAMQNGGSETDGVRFMSADGNYTDTVLYDSPNSNNLPADGQSASDSFGPDVTSGYSLARRADGQDTDHCGLDFIAEEFPTPGYPNHVLIDYALAHSELTMAETEFAFETFILNLSAADADTVTITLNVLFNDTVLQSFDIQPIPAGDSVFFSTPLSLNTQSNGSLKIELGLAEDINQQDNIWMTQIGTAQPISAAINEILYNPDSGNQEWVELYIPPQMCGGQEITLYDLAENSLDITLPSLCPPYLVLCEDTALLEMRYPECPAAGILEVNSLPALNNEGDVLVLKDATGAVLDSVSYLGNTNKKDYSLERHQETDSTFTWHYCFNAAKGTPGQLNSEPPPPSELEVGHIKLVGSPFNPLKGESMKLQYNFADETNNLSCYVYDLKGILRTTIASALEISQSGELVWNGKNSSGHALERGVYILLVEAKNSSGRYFLRRQLTVVLATK